MSTDPEILLHFESLGQELRRLRERDEAATAQIKDLEKKLGHAEQWVRRLREKIDVLEKKPAVLDGVDEQWLLENRVTLSFERDLSGKRAVKVRDHGNRLMASVIHRPDQPEPKAGLLREALNKAADRTRKAPAQSAGGK